MSTVSGSDRVELRGITYDFWNTIFAESPVAFEARLTANVDILAEIGNRRHPRRDAVGDERGLAVVPRPMGTRRPDQPF